jgi:hypothetical protein
MLLAPAQPTPGGTAHLLTTNEFLEQFGLNKLDACLNSKLSRMLVSCAQTNNRATMLLGAVAFEQYAEDHETRTGWEFR